MHTGKLETIIYMTASHPVFETDFLYVAQAGFNLRPSWLIP